MEEYPLAYDDIAACQLLGGKDVRKSGMIRKKSGGFKIPLIQSKYDLRFVIIKKGWVYYYEEKTSKKPQNKFSLQGFSNRVINAEEEQTIMPYAFKIYPMAANTRTWYFACENQQEMHDWMESFRLEIEQYNNRGSNLSRGSRSCPNNPVRSFSPHIGTSNRPQSINNPNINARPAPPPTSYFQSQSDITSGIGSSTSSLEQPEDFYEPTEGVSSPTHQPPTQLHSPPMRSPKPLPAVPEFPSRPPPLPPTDTKRDNFNFDQQGRKTDASRFPFTSPKPHAQSFDRFSPLPNRYPNESRSTTTPTLPPKPTNAGKGFSRQHVNNGGDYASNYDDTGRNVVLDQEEPGVYDNMKEYDEDTDLLYENDNNCVERSIAEEQGQSPTEMHHVSNWQANKGHSENQRPTWCDRETQRGDVEQTQFSNEVHHVEKPLGIKSPKVQNWQANQVHLQNAKAKWPAKEALQEDSKPDWLKAKLKPTAASKPAFQPKNNTGPISLPEKKISAIGSQTQPNQPWQKSKTLDSQNQAKPPVASKPKPNVNAKPATLQRPVALSTNFPPQSAADKKPLPPAKPKSNVPSAPKPASNFAAARRKFE